MPISNLWVLKRFLVGSPFQKKINKLGDKNDDLTEINSSDVDSTRIRTWGSERKRGHAR
jgi:hypothetical protein